VIRGDVDATGRDEMCHLERQEAAPNNEASIAQARKNMDMQHHFVYPKVEEIRRGGDQSRAQLRRRRSQRELVEASLLRCPPRRLAAGR
jgi:hypothetical protein